MSTKMLDSEMSLADAVERPHHQPRPGSLALPHGFVVLFVVMAVAALRANMLTLTTFPLIHTDEAWYANLAHNWITTGNRWTTLDVGPFPAGRGQSTTVLGALPTRFAVQVWGLSLQAIRLPSLLAGLALAAVVAAVGNLLWPGRSGPFAALVLMSQPLFLLGSHLARPEIWLTLVVLLAFGCNLLGWKREQPLLDVIAGLLTILAVEIHQNGAVFAIGLAVTYLARYGRTVLRQPNSLAFFGVSSIGALVYLYRNLGGLLPAHTGGDATILGVTSSHSIPLLSSSPVQWIINELVRYLVYFGNEPLGALLLGFGVLGALGRRDTTDRSLFAWLLGSAVAMMLLISHRLETYLLPLLSVGTLLTGRAMAELFQRQESWGRQVVMLILGVLALPLLLLLGKNDPSQPVRLQLELQQTVPCKRILGPNEYWLAFTNCDYRSWDVVSHYRHIRGISFDESMAAIHPDYLLIDNYTVLNKLREDFQTGGTTGSYYVMPQADFERFLAEKTTLVHWITTPGHGTIQVRKVHWDDTRP